MAEANAIRNTDVTTASSAKPANEHAYVVRRDGALYAGRHLLVDLWGARRLDDPAYIESVLRKCVEEAGATLLHVHLHRFSENGGVSGVAMLAESHISIHSWPEWDYAAIDIFMCGRTEPERAVEVLRRAFAPGRVEVKDYPRGRIG